MNVTIPYSNIIHFDYPTRKELVLSFFRVSEYYESNKATIQGKKFSIEQFLNEYMDNDGYVEYFMGWCGHNIPGIIVDEFMNSFDLTVREKAIRSTIRKHIDMKESRYYIIGTYDNNTAVLNHELAHALYSLNDEYRYEANEIVETMSAANHNKLSKKLDKMGYDAVVHDDEIQAYLATSNASELRSVLGVPFDTIKPQVTALRKLFKKHVPEQA